MKDKLGALITIRFHDSEDFDFLLTQIDFGYDNEITSIVLVPMERVIKANETQSASLANG